MAVLSSLFGRNQVAPAVGAQMISATELPPELRPYYKDILTKAQALYNDRTSQGYQPYTGPTIAEFTPEQQQVQAGIAGLVGSGEPVYQEAMGMTREAATPYTASQIEEYMSPYQQAVTDIEKREATKQFESQIVPELAAKAAMAQPFGGSRQAILEGMAADTQQRLLGDIQAKGSAQAYQDAISRLDADRLAKGQAATQLTNLQGGQFRQATTELSGLQSVGQEKQTQTQTALDEAFKQYLEEQQFPYDTMAKYQNVVTGAPIQPMQYVKPQAAKYEPSLGQQLIGGLGGLGNIYGAFTGRTIGGQPYQQPAKTGGGIGTLIKRANGGSTDSKTFERNFGIDNPDAYVNYLKNLAGPYSERFKRAEELTQQRNKLMEKDLKRDRSYLEADRANQQFNREQAAFSAMARLGIDQDVTDAPGGGAGQLLTMLAKAGPEIGAAETEQRAKIRQQDREVGKLEIKYKDAIAKGDLELANTYMAQLQALSGEYAKYMTAKAAGLDALGLNKITGRKITEVIKNVEAQTNPKFALLLTKGAAMSGLNPNIGNPDREGKAGVWTQNEILTWAQDNALQRLQLDLAAGKTVANTQIAFDNMVTRNIISLFTGNEKVADVSEGAEKTIDDNVVDSPEVIDSTKGNAKDTILSF
jgi:hypothetical protein